MQARLSTESILSESTNNFSYPGRIALIVLRARGLYEDVCDELELTDPDDDRRCLALSDIADALCEFIGGVADE